jgi:hypothetical protein
VSIAQLTPRLADISHQTSTLLTTRFSRNQVKVTLRLTVSQSVRGSWPDIYYSLTVTLLFLWGALSDERTGLSFVYAASPRQVAFLGSESLGTRDHILLSQIRDLPFRRLLRLAGSRWRYSTPPPNQTPTLLTTRFSCDRICSLLYSLGTDRTKNAAFNSSVVACVCCCHYRGTAVL